MLVRLLAVTVGVLLLSFATMAQGLVVTQNTSATDLANALIRGSSGLAITDAQLDHRTAFTAVSTGLFTNASGTYGIGSGIILSTGNVSDYGDGPNTSSGFTTSYGTIATPDLGEMLDPITGPHEHYDVTRLDLTFDLMPGYNAISFNLVFGSEEYAEFGGTMFNDGFGIFLNGSNIAFVNDLPINISHPDVRSIEGTELDGILAPNDNPLVGFTSFVGDGTTSNTLTIILADTSDPMLDTTAYLSELTGTVVPEPGSLATLAAGLLGVGGAAIRRRRRHDC